MTPWRPTRRWILLLVALLAAGCSSGDPEGTGSGDVPGTEPVRGAPSPDSGFPADWSPDPLQWGGCDIGVVDGAECAELSVPLDWAEPGGQQIELAIARVPATGDRIGSLLVNPGGPGASGIDYLGQSPLRPALTERFDLVSWDPRGVGASTAVACGASVPHFYAQDPSPDDALERAQLENAAEAVSSECATEDGGLLEHLNTAEVARDLEAIRAALGEEPLNYLGFSYGTHIGQVYAELFGDHVRSMVLDGVVDPALGLEEFLLGQTVAFEAAFAAADAACARAGASSCGVEDLSSAYGEVAVELEREPLRGATEVGPAELAVAATYTAYLDDGWRLLGPALADALAGDGDAVWELASGYYQFGSYGAYAGVICTDTAHPPDPAAYATFAQRAGGLSERFGPSVANEMLPCATWGAVPQDRAAAVTAPDAPPILVIGNTGDPATPLRNAESVASSLRTGRLLVVDADGHTAYGSDACASEVVEQYLVDLVLPEPGSSC